MDEAAEAAARESLKAKGVDVDSLEAGEVTESRGSSRVEVRNVGIGFGEIESPSGVYEKAMLLDVSLTVIMDDTAIDDLTAQLAAMRGKVLVAKAMPRDHLTKGGMARG